MRYRSPSNKRRDKERSWKQVLRSLMFSEAARDHEIKESIATHKYSYHPIIPIESGDVLTQDKRYVHPALVTPHPRPPLDPKSKRFWKELIDALPKVKVGSK